MRRIAILGLLVLLAVLAMPAASAAPDLIVEGITPNCGGYLFGNESNNISAVIGNTGFDGASASDASFVLSDGYSEIVSVPALGAGDNTTVSITDPTTRNAGDSVTITVTADCNGAVSEGNESNNATDLGVTVINNGYKGKTYTGGPNMTTWKSYDLNGNLVYSVGDSYYLSSYSYPHWTAYNASWTASDLPVTGTVKEARLYATYTWDKDGVMPDDVSVSFNGGDQEPEDAHYWDDRAFPNSKPYGMLVYNVTGDFNAGGNYANLTNSHIGGDNISMRGMVLIAIYEDACEPRRQIYINEEFDLLYGGSSKCTTPEEATAWAPITGSIMDDVLSAKLITVAPGAGPNEGELIFNGQVWNGVWNFAGSSQIGIDERDVTSYLDSTDNLVGFQSNADWMEASNAILIVEETPNATVFFEPSDSGADYDNTTTVGVWVDTSEAISGGNLYFDYTFCCANVTGYTPNTINFEFAHLADLSVAGKVSIGFGTLNKAGKGPGLLHIGDIDIHCCNESYCKTGLIWNCGTSNLARPGSLGGGIVDPVKWEDGTFRCTNLPDLVITEVYGTQTTGDNYTVSYTVKNIGNVNASAGHTTTLYIDGVVKDHDIPVELAPGGTYTGTFGIELTMTAPNDLMKVCADTGDDCMEIDEDNNCMESFYPAGIELSVNVLDDGECVDFQEQFLVNITVDPRNIPVYGVEYVLTFDNSVLHAEWQNEGTFLNSDGADTNVYINTIDNGAGTISFAATRVNTPDGIKNPPGTLAVIKFTAIQQGGSSNLTLSNVVAANEGGGEIDPLDLIDDSVCVWENVPPVAIGKSMHNYSNDGQKYICKVYFNGTESSDPNGEVIYWRWAFGDGNYGTGELKDHVYQSWNWNTLTEEYDPFVASLTVTDDGDPHQLDNTTYFDVIVYTAGDANGDGKVNILDATIVGLEWGETTDCSGAYCWDENDRGSKADLNNDCKVNILDAVIIGTCWGHTAW
ncbi:MAG: DUF3344 domain-containing protein [Euryarchaeota archaeon]|nr:DUF3344 domain-containing protein [Euryarchaeota archaeon]